jgi:hypothetical protein
VITALTPIFDPEAALAPSYFFEFSDTTKKTPNFQGFEEGAYGKNG